MVIGSVEFWNLEVGSWAEWFSALGTIAAVFVAVLAPYFVNRPKLKLNFSMEYLPPEIALRTISIKALNTGKVPIKVTDLGFNIKRTGKHIGVKENIDQYLQQNDDVSSNFEAIELFEGLIRSFPKQKKFILVPYAKVSQGTEYTGRPLKISRKEINNELIEMRS